MTDTRNEPAIRVGLAIPTAGAWVADFGMDVVRMSILAVLSDPQIAIFPYQITSSQLSSSRTSLAKAAVNRGCTHVLWLDTDMRFPTNALHRLLAHDRDIVGINYSRKMRPFLPTAAGLDGQHMYSWGKTGLEEAFRLGLGLCLMKTSVFDGLNEGWFNVLWSEAKQGYLGEDTHFFRHVRREKGIQTWCDHDLSNECGHVGSFIYTTEMSEAGRAEARDSTPMIDV